MLYSAGADVVLSAHVNAVRYRIPRYCSLCMSIAWCGLASPRVPKQYVQAGFNSSMLVLEH